MKVAFVSNYLNHHQIPFCTYMKRCCEQFYFIATDTENIWGYQEIVSAEYVYIYNDKNRSLINNIILQADIVIFGSSPHELIQLRMAENKLSFLYSERFYRKGVWRRWNPRTLIKLYDRIVRYRKSNMYVLCASAFLPYDLKLIGYPVNKCFKWGYFPAIEKYDVNELFKKKTNSNGKVSLVWVGRLIELKHPEIVINLSESLRKSGYCFDVNIIGDGPMKDTLQKDIDEKNLSGYIHLVGSKTPKEVREYMEQSSISLFTSDRREGWGAVLSESMGYGCTPVCSHAIGSVPFLIRNGENGFVYQYGNQLSFVSMVKRLLNNPETCTKMGRNAYQDMISLWNAEVAAKRLLVLGDDLLFGRETQFESGPCSKATMIKDNWM